MYNMKTLPKLSTACIDSFNECWQFDSDETLRSVFNTDLQVLIVQLPSTQSKLERVEKTIELLLSIEPVDGQHPLFLFILLLRKGYFPGDIQYEKLGQVYSLAISLFADDETKNLFLPPKKQNKENDRDLYERLRSLFLRCREFESYDALLSVFVSSELRSFRFGVKRGNSVVELVDLNLDYLIKQHTSDNQSVLPAFVDALRRRYQAGDNLKDELEKIYHDIQNAIRPNNQVAASSLERERMLFSYIIKIDFRAQVRLVREIISNQRIASFLIHGSPDYGQRTLAYRLSNLQPEWSTGQRIIIDAGSKGLGKSSGFLWRQIARKLDLDQNADPELIAERVCKWWQTQDVIIIFDTVDYLPIESVSSWINDFWQPVVKLARSMQHRTLRRTNLLLFLVDYGGKCQNGIKFTKRPSSMGSTHLPLLLPSTQKIPSKELEIWFDLATEVLPRDFSVQKLLAETQNGTPELIFEKIYEYCGLNWEGEINL